MARHKQVTVYTDGACLGNPGPGGYGAVILTDDERRELSGGFRRTTNNRMEMMAAIVALQSLEEGSQVTLYSDSEYLVKAISSGWARRWQRNGWMRNRRERALNPDLWERLLDLCGRHDVEFRWIKGHADSAENARADLLAMQAAQRPGQPDDVGYAG